MAGPVKRRRVEDEVRRPKKKRIRNFKKQAEYHSSSEDDDEDAAAPIRRKLEEEVVPTGANAVIQQKSTKQAVKTRPPVAVHVEEKEAQELDETEVNTALNIGAHDSADSEDDAAEDMDVDELEGEDMDELDDDEPDLSSEDESDTTTPRSKAQKKRHDPEAFATSISKILTTKLSTQKRSDPILSRSRTAEEANKSLADSKLETKARAAIRAERKALLEKGRVKDVLGLETDGVDTGAIQEEEKRLKKIAQRGVVKLFNAVRAAQVRAEEAESRAKAEGVVGMRKREDRVNEMSKEGFLDLISRGGKQAVEA